jgi:hypothetical protein
VNDRFTEDESFQVAREDLEPCHEAIKNYRSALERPRNVARIAATLMTLHENGWITVEEAVTRGEYIEAILWEAHGATTGRA